MGIRTLRLASFNGVAANSIATAQVPAYNRSLGKITLTLGGTATKANTSRIAVKIGSRVIFGPVSASQLDAVMKYRGQFDIAARLSIDFTERNAMTRGEKEVGAIDLPGLGGDAVFVEATSSAASPTFDGVVGYTDRQFADVNRDGRITRGEQGRQRQLIHKLIPYSIPATGTRQVWQPNFGGAQIKRIHFIYTGTDWTSTTNGNLASVECKANGIAVHDNVLDLDNRFQQQENGLVPQSRTYTLDFCTDHDIRGALDTRGLRSLEFVLNFTASDSCTALVECLDAPDNL